MAKIATTIYMSGFVEGRSISTKHTLYFTTSMYKKPYKNATKSVLNKAGLYEFYNNSFPTDNDRNILP